MSIPPALQVTWQSPRDAGVVVHVPGSGRLSICSYDRDRCGPPSWLMRHCPTCTCTIHPPARPEGMHGEYVRCRCGRDGVLPDRDHILDFLPPGSTVEHGTPEHPDKVIITFGRG